MIRRFVVSQPFESVLFDLFISQVLQEEIGGVKGHFGPINALAFNPDGKRYSFFYPILPNFLNWCQ